MQLPINGVCPVQGYLDVCEKSDAVKWIDCP